MILLRLTWQSLLNRKSTVLLTILTISLSVMLLLSVDSVRTQTKDNFSSTVSGTDLIVGARSGAINLLLYSVFHIGNATNNISWKSYQQISNHAKVKWSIPLSLGDSHRGYRVLGTDKNFFEHFRYGKQQPLNMQSGEVFDDVFEVVLGADVAAKLGYKVGDSIVVAHGVGNVALVEHDQTPFTVVGILQPTGTPIDRLLMVSLQAIEAIHLDWKGGIKLPGVSIDPDAITQEQLQPKQITAFMLGLHSRISTFHMQRSINNYHQEPLLAILPGLTLQELWQVFNVIEQALLSVSALVALSSLIGLLTLMLTNLNERRREMSILRAVGARPVHIFVLLCLESMLITLASIVVGVLGFYLAQSIAAPLLQQHYGISLATQWLTLWQLQLLAALLLVGTFVGCIPGIKAYRNALIDGMSVKI